MLNPNNHKQYQQCHPVNIQTISQLKDILHAFSNKIKDIAFISNDSILENLSKKQCRVYIAIKQHHELEKLYTNYCMEYRQKKQETEKIGPFIESIDTEEIESLKQNTKLYHDSVKNHTLRVVELIEGNKDFKRMIDSELNHETVNKNISQKWMKIIDSIKVFESIISSQFDYNWKYHQLKNKELHKLKTRVAKEKSTLTFLSTKQQKERKEREYKLQTLYNRILSLQNKIDKLKHETQNKQDSKQKYHQNWMAENIKTWTKETKEIDRANDILLNKFNEIREKDRLSEKTQLRRIMVKQHELTKLESEYKLSIKQKYDQYSKLKREYEQSQDKLLLIQDSYKNIQAIQAKESIILHQKTLTRLCFCIAILMIKLVRARKRLENKHKDKDKDKDRHKKIKKKKKLNTKTKTKTKKKKKKKKK